jgi:serine/threonine-protein kinase RsbT
LRGKALNIATSLGFPTPEATKVAVVVSELARNIIHYAEEGSLSLAPSAEGIAIVAQDRGPGIPNLDAVLSGEYTSEHGMGVGLSGSRRMMDEFEISTEVGKGTTITAAKWLRPRSQRRMTRTR